MSDYTKNAYCTTSHISHFMIIVICMCHTLWANAQFTASDFNLKLYESIKTSFNNAAKTIYNPHNVETGDSILNIGISRRDTSIILAGMLLKMYPCMVTENDSLGQTMSEKIREYASVPQYSYAFYTAYQFEVAFHNMRNDFHGSLILAKNMSRHAVEHRDVAGINMAYYAMGTVFMMRDNPRMAERYFLLSAESAEKVLLFRYVWPSYYKLAVCRQIIGDYEQAFKYLKKAEHAAILTNNKHIEYRLHTIRVLIGAQIMPDAQFIKEAEELIYDDKYVKSISSTEYYLVKSQYLARKRLKEESLAVADSVGQGISGVANKKNIYAFFNDWENAYKMATIETSMHDSLQAMIQMHDISALDGEMNSISEIIVAQDVEKMWHRVLNYILAIIFGIASLITIYIAIKRRRKAETNKNILELELENRNDEISRVNQKLNDIVSLSNANYAFMMAGIKYNQMRQHELDAALRKYIGTTIKDCVSYYSPSREITGDTTIMRECDGKLVIACIDSCEMQSKGTILSMMCARMLYDIIENSHQTSPSLLLDALDSIIAELAKENAQGQHIDMSIVTIDLSTRKVEWAAANESIYLISHGDFTEHTGSHRGIGETQIDENGNSIVSRHSFETHSFEPSADDILYICSNGITMQSNGEETTRKNGAIMRSFLMKFCFRHFYEQKTLMPQLVNVLQKDNKATDDITIIGIKF